MGAHPGLSGQHLAQDSSLDCGQQLGGSEADGGMENGATAMSSVHHPSNGPLSSNVKVDTSQDTRHNFRQSTRHPTTQTKALQPLIFKANIRLGSGGENLFAVQYYLSVMGQINLDTLFCILKQKYFSIQGRNAIMSNVIQTIFCLETIKGNESF